MGSNPSGSQKLSSLQGNEVWQNLPVRAKVRDGEETTLLSSEQKENQAQLPSGWENEHQALSKGMATVKKLLKLPVGGGSSSQQGREPALADTSTATLNRLSAESLAKASPRPRAGLVMFNGPLHPRLWVSLLSRNYLYWPVVGRCCTKNSHGCSWMKLSSSGKQPSFRAASSLIL